MFQFLKDHLPHEFELLSRIQFCLEKLHAMTQQSPGSHWNLELKKLPSMRLLDDAETSIEILSHNPVVGPLARRSGQLFLLVRDAIFTPSVEDRCEKLKDLWEMTYVDSELRNSLSRRSAIEYELSMDRRLSNEELLSVGLLDRGNTVMSSALNEVHNSPFESRADTLIQGLHTTATLLIDAEEAVSIEL